jgi:hypothetical protein
MHTMRGLTGTPENSVTHLIGAAQLRCAGSCLVVFARLPGSAKSVLARGAADAIGAMYLRIDTIESAIVSTLGLTRTIRWARRLTLV